MPWTNTTIEVARLRLRMFRDDDKPTIIALASDPDVRRYLGGPVSSEHLDAIRRATVGKRWGVFCVADLAGDEPIGRISFGRDHGELEVSYELLAAHWGRGLATEAVSAAIEWANPQPWVLSEDDPMSDVFGDRETAAVVFLDGAGRVLKKSEMTNDKLKAMLTIDGGEAIER